MQNITNFAKYTVNPFGGGVLWIKINYAGARLGRVAPCSDGYMLRPQITKIPQRLKVGQ